MYVDGKQVNSNPKENDLNQAIITPIPSNSRVIAVQVTNLFAGPAGGFKGALSDNSVVTDGSWKCSPTFTNGWQNIDFDDSLWPAASATGSYSNCNFFTSSAKWLWTDRYYDKAITIYCRRTLSKYLYYYRFSFINTFKCQKYLLNDIT